MWWEVKEIVSVIDQAIAMLTGAAVLALVGLLIHRYRFSKRTQHLLKSMYELAEGDPDAIVDSREVVKRADIFTKGRTSVSFWIQMSSESAAQHSPKRACGLPSTALPPLAFEW